MANKRRNARASIGRWTVIGLVLFNLPLASAVEGSSTDAIERGRSLYVTGVRSDGQPLQARLHGSDEDLPQAFVACANCHGFEARGALEGGSAASDIRWQTLSKPYEVVRADGRRRAPYDPASFLVALTAGLDPSGQALDATMPRFAVSRADADDLRHYLQSLVSASNQGVSSDLLRIGFLASKAPAEAAHAESDRRLLNCWFDQINDQGGLFRRQVEFVPLDQHSVRQTPAMLAVLASGPPLERTTPLLGVPILSSTADALGAADRYRFAIDPGLVARASLLVRFATQRDTTDLPTLALLYGPQTTSSERLSALLAALAPLSRVDAMPITTNHLDAAFSAIERTRPQHVLIADSAIDVDDLIDKVRQTDLNPLFLWPEAPRHEHPAIRALTLLPGLPGDVTVEALAKYTRCASVDTPDRTDRQRQQGLLATAQLLVAGLEQSGRDVSRERLVESLQSLREFESGFAPPGSLSAQRPIATSGLYVVSLPESKDPIEPVWLRW